MNKVSWEEAEKALAKVGGKIYLDSAGIAHVTEAEPTGSGLIDASSVQSNPKWMTEWGIESDPENHDVELLLKEVIYLFKHFTWEGKPSKWGTSLKHARKVLAKWSEVARALLGVGNSYAVEEWVMSRDWGEVTTLVFPHGFDSPQARDKWVSEWENEYPPSEEGNWRRRALDLYEADSAVGIHGCTLHGKADDEERWMMMHV